MDIAKIIGVNLTAWMKDTPGLDTIEKVEQESGIGFGTVRRTKKGDGNITVEKLTAIAQAFGRHPAELMIAVNNSTGKLVGDYSRVIDGEALRLEVRSGAPSTPAAPVIKLPSPRLVELAAVAEKIDNAGLERLLGYAHRLAEERPRKGKGNAAPSSS